MYFVAWPSLRIAIPRSVRKVIAGKRVLPRVREKIVRALKDQGFGHLVDEGSDGPRAA